MTNFLQDLQFAWRSFRRTPGVTALALATVAIGIGANAAVYSVIRSVLIAPLPYAHLDGLALGWRSNPAISGLSISPAMEDIDRWRGARSLDGLTSYSSRSLTLTGHDEPQQLIARMLEPNAFEFLGVRPRVGRPFAPEDAASIGAAHVVLLGDALWHQRFGADPAVVGRTVMLSDEPYTIVGVMPAGFRLPLGKGDLFIPFVHEAKAPPGVNVIVRVRQGVSFTAAEGELTGLMGSGEMAGVPGKWRARLMAPAEMTGSSFRRALMVLLGAVALVLLIGCANVAALVVARNAARRREMAVRAALGASRGRLIRQLVTESLLLSLAGGAAGLVLGIWILHALAAIRPAQMDELAHVAMSPQMFGVAAGLSLLTGVLFGMAPALAGTRVAVIDALKEAARGASGRHGTPARRLLTIVEVALACILLVGAGLLLRSYARMLAADPGFQPEHRVAFHVSLPATHYASAAARSTFFESLLGAARSLPGVQRAALGNGIPPSGSVIFGTLEIEGAPATNGGAPSAFAGGWVGPDYFRTLGIPIRDGREFVDSDRRSIAPPMIINETAARRFFGGQRALGRHVRMSPHDAWSTIVGVVGDLKGNARGFGDVEIYQPLTADNDGDTNLIASVSGDPTTALSALKAAVWTLDPNLPVTNATTLEAAMAETMSRPRFNLVLLGSFALVGLLLAAIGIYGVISASVAQRTQEIGVRMALGALPRDIRRAIVGDAAVLAGIGLAVGVGGALALTRVMTAMLFETSAADPISIGATVVVLGATAILAAWVPARRAMRVDPMVAMRE